MLGSNFGDQTSEVCPSSFEAPDVTVEGSVSAGIRTPAQRFLFLHETLFSFKTKLQSSLPVLVHASFGKQWVKTSAFSIFQNLVGVSRLPGGGGGGGVLPYISQIGMCRLKGYHFRAFLV